MSGADERRRSPRVLVSIEATMRVLFPEDTFRPQPLPVETHDLSMFGMRVSAHFVSKDFYKKLLVEVRYAKMEIKLPGVDEPQSLHGRIVWVDYNTRLASPVCQIGVMFEKLNPEQHRAMEHALQILQNSKPTG